MIKEGQIVLFKFPLADKSDTKLRPALVIREIPGRYGDWLACMISSQLSQQVAGFDEVMDTKATDWEKSGLRIPSVIRVARVAVVHESVFLGGIGEVDPSRLDRIKQKPADWILGG